MYYEITGDGERKDCPHTEDQINSFKEQVSENIGDAVKDNHLAPIVVSKAEAEQIVDASSLFSIELTGTLDSQKVMEVESAISAAWDEKYPGIQLYYYFKYY